MPNPAPKSSITLKRGSLYRIIGSSVARFRSVAYGDYVVMSVHNKPVVVERGRVVLASKEDVQHYLKDAGV
jgi:hypothetical protein